MIQDMTPCQISGHKFNEDGFCSDCGEHNRIVDVHTEHCCQIHGCKYGPEWNEETGLWQVSNCTVKNLIAPQSYPCEWCDDEEELAQAYELNEMFDRGRRFALAELNRDIVGWKIQ